MRYGRIVFMGCVVPMLLAAGAGVIGERFFSLVAMPKAATAVFIGSAAAAIALWAASAWRLKRWESGAGPACERCSGPLGWFPHPGRLYFGRQLRDFHRCWNCGKANGIS